MYWPQYCHSAKLAVLHKNRQRGTAAALRRATGLENLEPGIRENFNRKNSNINLSEKARTRSRTARPHGHVLPAAPSTTEGGPAARSTAAAQWLLRCCCRCRCCAPAVSRLPGLETTMSHPQSARGDPITVSNDATYSGGVRLVCSHSLRVNLYRGAGFGGCGSGKGWV